MTNWRQITESEALEIIENREPRGLFLIGHSNGTWTAIDNRDGDAWTEDFLNNEDAEAWLLID